MFNRTLSNSIKDYIFLAVLLLEGFVKGAQRKEQMIALFVKRFNVVSLRRFP